MSNGKGEAPDYDGSTPLRNIREEKYCQNLVAGTFETDLDAYEAAGYIRHQGNQARVKKKPDVAARIRFLQAQVQERTIVTVERVIEELARVGLSDIRRAFTPGGNLLPIRDLDDDLAAAIAGVEVVVRPSGQTDENGNREVEHVHKIRLWDKNSALEKIAKHLGMLKERHEHTGPNGGPIQYENMTPEQRRARIDELERKRRGRTADAPGAGAEG